MRIALAAAALSFLAACATAPATPSAGGWSLAYDARNGETVATQREPGGAVTAAISCRAPNGDLRIADYTLAAAGGEARVTVGGMSVEAPARRDGGALVVSLAQSPPILAAVGNGAPMSVSAGGRTHALAQGASIKLREVALACWPQGS